MSPPTPTGATSAASPWACHGPRPRTGAALPGLRDRAGREVLRAVRTRQHRARPVAGHPQAGASSPASMTWRAVVRADPDWFAVVRGQNGGRRGHAGVPPVRPGAPLRAVRRPDDDRPAQPHPWHRPRHRPRRTGPRRVGRARAPRRPLRGLGPRRPGLQQRHHTRRRGRPDPAAHPVPLPDRAVIRLGAWTTITLAAAPALSPADTARGQSR